MPLRSITCPARRLMASAMSERGRVGPRGQCAIECREATGRFRKNAMRGRTDGSLSYYLMTAGWHLSD